jgi:hypothetical protein
MLMKGILDTCISTVLLGKEIKMEFYLNLHQKLPSECLLWFPVANFYYLIDT